MTPVPDDVREGYAEVVAQLRAVAEVVADVSERVDRLEARMREACGDDVGDVPAEAWDEAGAGPVPAWASYARMVLDPMDPGAWGNPAAAAAAYGMPDVFVELAEKRARESGELTDHLLDAWARQRDLEGRVFDMLTDGLDGEAKR